MCIANGIDDKKQSACCGFSDDDLAFFLSRMGWVRISLFFRIKESLFSFFSGNFMFEPIFFLVTFIPDKFNWLTENYHKLIVYTGLDIVKW